MMSPPFPSHPPAGPAYGPPWLIAGSPSLRPVLQALVDAFGQAHPGCAGAISLELAGAAVGVARLIHGKVLLGALAREISDEETVPYRKGVGERPCAVRIADADPAAPEGRSRALTPYVHAGNPAASLSLRELARIFSTGHLDGDCRHWGQAGLDRDGWSHRPIRPLVQEEGSPLGTHLRRHVFDGRPLSPSCEQLGSVQALLARLASEPSGITIAPAGCGLPGVRPLRLVPDIADGNHPLNPGLLIYLRRSAGGCVHPAARAFCRFALSSPGQQAIRAAAAGYLPLAPARAETESQRLQDACTHQETA